MPSLSIEEYHVGIICALHSELAAVEAMLDEEYESIKTQDGYDHNAYSAGRIHQHNVVIACLPAGVDGLAAAGTVAKDMLRTFRQLRFGLLVGIGGGIPDPEREVDIRLGDVVVSEPSGTEGGVVQYDKGKSQTDNVWERKGTLNAPPTVLLTALQKLKARHMRYDSQMPTLIAEMLQKYPKMAKFGYSYPGQGQDPQPCRETNNPEIHYGIIASGNGVIKDAIVRDRIRGECGALCVEMEAAGLMNTFPCLVIRGICDYADADKNDQWHRYAAATAAAYAKELLSCVSAEQTSQEKPVQSFLGILNEHFDQAHAYHGRHEAHLERQETSYHSDKHRDCHRAFKTSNYEEHKNINPDRAPNTCQWLLQHSKFLQWQENHHSDLLWISADPGCGKSVLSKSLIDQDLCSSGDNPDTTICYFFFKDNQVQDGLATALCALLHQLFDSQPQLIRHALPAWEKTGSKIAFEVDELWRIFEKATADHEVKPVVCVLDALDECRDSDRRRLISLLCRFYNDMVKAPQTGHLKFLTTSRPYEDIEHNFGRIITSLPSIRLRGEDENDQIRKEIDLVVRQRVQEMMTDFYLAPQTAKNLEQKLLGMEHRTYLWLYLAIDSIRQTFSRSLRPGQESIELLPKSVDEAYEQILSKVDANQTRDVRMILTIIVGVPRPLSVGEMALALDVATSTTTLQSFSDLTITESQLLSRIRHWCGLFVFINHSRLYLIHQTAKEFLLSNPEFNRTSNDGWRYCLSATDVEREMARIYMLYLCLQDFEEQDSAGLYDFIHGTASLGLADSDISQPQNWKHNMFKLAAESWPDLWRNIQFSADEELQDKAWTLYDMQSRRYSRWSSVMWLERRHRSLEGTVDMVLAAYNGHIVIIRRILSSRPQDLEVKDARGYTALVSAAARGFDDIVALLLERGAHIDVEVTWDGNALYIASENGHERVVQLLIEAGADPNVQDGYYGNALQSAAHNGHTGIVQILVEAGANVNARGGRNDYALTAASERGFGKVVRILVEAGADVNNKGDLYETALEAALEGDYEEVVDVLVKGGVDLNAQGAEALQVASKRGHEKVVQVLLRAGVDVNTQGINGNALYAASEYGRKTMVGLLLEAGANVQAQAGEFCNALQVASVYGHQQVVQVLLEAGADVNARGGPLGTALQAAAEGGYENVVQTLLDAGADVNAQGGYYGSALDAAMECGFHEVEQALFKAGAKTQNHRRKSDDSLYDQVHFALLSRDEAF